MKRKEYVSEERFSEFTEDFKHKLKIASKEHTEKLKQTIRTESLDDTNLRLGNSLLNIGCSKNIQMNVNENIL